MNLQPSLFGQWSTPTKALTVVRRFWLSY